MASHNLKVTTTNEEQSSNKIYREEKYNKIISILFYIGGVFSCMFGTSHSNISENAGKAYGGTEQQVYFLSMIPLVSFLICNFPYNFILDKYGLRKSMILCGLLLIVGSFLKKLIHLSFNFAILGHFLTSSTFCIYNNGIPKLSLTWFLEENTVKITTYMASLVMIGYALGYLLNIIFFGNVEVDDALKENLQKAIQLNFTFCLFLSCLLLIAYYFYYKDKPAQSPSKAAEAERTEFFASLKILSQDKEYLKLNVYFIFTESTFQNFNFMTTFLLKSFGLQENQIFIIGMILNISSACSYFIFGHFSHHFKLKQALLIMSVGMSITMFLFYLSLNMGILFVIIICTILFGLFYALYAGPSFELASELVFPVGEEHATGGLIFSSSLGAIIFSYLIEFIYKEMNQIAGNVIFIMFIIIYVLSFFMMKSIKELYKRQAYNNPDKLMETI
jgi:MFS family permease